MGVPPRAASPQISFQPSELKISAIHLRPFLRCMRARSLDPDHCLARARLPKSSLDRDLLVPVSKFLEFLRLCMHATNDENLGLRAGEQARLEDLDLVGLLMRSVPAGRDAYAALQQHQRLWGPARDAEVSVSDEGIACRHVGPGKRPTPRAWGDYFAARVVTLARAVAGDVEPVAVCFKHPCAPDLGEYQRLFGSASLSFGAAENVVVLPASLLGRAMPHADAAVVAIVSRQLKSHPAPVESDECLVHRVRSVIVTSLDTNELSIGHVARRLHQSERTLRRQLQANGTSYQTIFDEVRLELASQYIATGLSKAEAGSRVGFRGQAAFYRALKRWTSRPLAGGPTH
jgi:AraC-like DNA-binding protein